MFIVVVGILGLFVKVLTGKKVTPYCLVRHFQYLVRQPSLCLFSCIVKMYRIRREIILNPTCTEVEFTGIVDSEM